MCIWGMGGICTCMQLPTEARGIRSPETETEITGECESPVAGAGEQTRVLFITEPSLQSCDQFYEFEGSTASTLPNKPFPKPKTSNFYAYI